jgi:flavin-binding protein dodecin
MSNSVAFNDGGADRTVGGFYVLGADQREAAGERAVSGVSRPADPCYAQRGIAMPESVYSVSEIVGSSTESLDDAIKGAVDRASKTLHNLDWFEVTGIRGRIEENQLCHFQVTLKVGFRLDEPTSG